MLLFGVLAVPASAATPGDPSREHLSLCQSDKALCADPFGTVGGGYVGHDEPSVIFKSDRPGSGNDMTYEVTLPKDPQGQPQNDGSGPTWNFQLRPTFWFGLALCDTESAPEFTKQCKADSDKNDLVGLDPSKPDYISIREPRTWSSSSTDPATSRSSRASAAARRSTARR
jgi:hypothetical protein